MPMAQPHMAPLPLLSSAVGANLTTQAAHVQQYGGGSHQSVMAAPQQQQLQQQTHSGIVFAGGLPPLVQQTQGAPSGVEDVSLGPLPPLDEDLPALMPSLGDGDGMVVAMETGQGLAETPGVATGADGVSALSVPMDEGAEAGLD